MTKEDFDKFMDRVKEHALPEQYAEITRRVVSALDRERIRLAIGVDEEMLQKARDALDRDPSLASRLPWAAPRSI